MSPRPDPRASHHNGLAEDAAFADRGFIVRQERQFLLPTVLHRRGRRADRRGAPSA
jgi:hypothetical protein